MACSVKYYVSHLVDVNTPPETEKDLADDAAADRESRMKDLLNLQVGSAEGDVITLA